MCHLQNHCNNSQEALISERVNLRLTPVNSGAAFQLKWSILIEEYFGTQATGLTPSLTEFTSEVKNNDSTQTNNKFEGTNMESIAESLSRSTKLNAISCLAFDSFNKLAARWINFAVSQYNLSHIFLNFQRLTTIPVCRE